MSTEKDLNYWKANAEEDYKQVPISVLRYITELETAVKNCTIQNVSGLLQPISAVMEFAEWCKENNEILNKKGCDVLECVKEWELSLVHSSNNR